MEQDMMASDSLVVRCKSGDPVAARMLYEKYSNAMYNICLRMMNNVPDAEDMLQEAFYQVFKNIRSYRGEATIGAWIRRIVINKCLNEVRKKTPSFMEADNIEVKEDEPIDEQKHALQVDGIQQAMRQLPDGYRVVFTLYLFEGCSHKEIAEKLGVSVSTVKTQYMRAKKKVRGILKRDSSAWQ